MNSVIVVEGAHDASKVRSVYPDAHIIVTNGTALSDETLGEIKMLAKHNEIILFLDPDYPGNQIRNKISSLIPEARHAYIQRDQATNGKKIGVEHASNEAIKASLQIKEVANATDIDFKFLLEYGYIGCTYAKEKRMGLLNYFNIGYVNGKGLLKKLSLFGITKQQVKDYESEKAFRSELLKK